jgi:2-polyprenyl-6-methoxyphenol hydroxylase-like FAD-dependent oxidoreductase
MEETKSGRVLIIGGGIGGLAAAVALKRIGIDAAVFERAPELTEVGAGLSLWSNAIKALGRLGLADAIVARGSVIGRAQTLTAGGRLLSEAPLGEIGRAAGAPSVCVHRADVQQLLARAAGVVHLGSVCVGIEDGDGVTARFADGRTERGELLIGADGIRSAVRAHLHGPFAPRPAGYVAYRGIARFTLPDDPPDRSRLALGPGSQAGILPCGPGRTYWFATAPAAGPSGHPKGEALARFGDWLPPLPRVIEATDPAAVMRHDVFDLPPVWPWGRGRVTLLGDAAHATTPNLGQGACQAIEDAVVLADRLRTHGPTAAGLRAYEDARRARTERIVRLSRQMGRMLQWKNPLAVWARNRLMGSRPGRRRGEALFAELLGYDVPQLPAARPVPAGHF